MATKIASVGPAISTNSSNIPASPMLRLLSTLTPPSSPRTTDTIATKVTPKIIATWVEMPLSIPNRKCRPLAACWAPKPSDVASPKIVASTATISIRCPA